IGRGPRQGAHRPRRSGRAAPTTPPLLPAVQDAWLNLEVVQCGFCQSGQIMTAVTLVDLLPNPTDRDIDAGMTGHICRCGTYLRSREAIKAAARSLAKR